MRNPFLRYWLGMHPVRPGLALLAVAAIVAVALPIEATGKDRRPAVVVADHTDKPQEASAPKASGGIVSGQVTSVDYQRGVLGVQSGGRKIDVTVLPSTNIQGKGSGYHSIAEISRGAHVEIFTSQSDGKYTAQIIRLR
jgi:hypothetical protein